MPDCIIAMNGDISTVEAKIDIPKDTPFFVRLRVQRPADQSHPAPTIIKAISVHNRLDIFARRGEIDVAQKIASRH